jgi:periplasmic protein TonB
MAKLQSIIFRIVLFVVTPLAAEAQSEFFVNEADTIYTSVDVLPEFPGGMKALGKLIDTKHHHYPVEARKNNIEGKVVVSFVVTKDGTPTSFKIVKGLGYGCDEAAVEALKKMPKWKPGLVKGKPVNTQLQTAYLYKL